jgi:hypothetical protein
MDIAKIRQQLVSDPEVRDMVAHRAFEIYVQRHGGPGSAAEDWLRAESEIVPRLVAEIVTKNRVAIEAHDDSAPTVTDAAERMQHEIEAADAAANPAKKPARKAAAKPATAAKAAAKPAAKTAAKPAKAEAAEKPAPKKSPAKKAAAKPAPVEAAAEAATKKPARKAPAKKKD